MKNELKNRKISLYHSSLKISNKLMIIDFLNS